MMFGSYFYNLWAALVSFTVYFFTTFQKPYTPIRILISSFIVAIIGFFVMYAVRFLIAYIFYTPNKEEKVDEDVPLADAKDTTAKSQTAQQSSTVEFKDESTEEIAQVVRTMMNDNDE